MFYDPFRPAFRPLLCVNRSYHAICFSNPSGIQIASLFGTYMERGISLPLLLQKFPCCCLHPQLRIQSMRKLEPPRQRLRVLPTGRRINKHALEMECRESLFLVGRDFHREKTVARPRLRIQW